MSNEYLFRGYLPEDEQFVDNMKWLQQYEIKRGHIKSTVSVFAHEFAREGEAGLSNLRRELEKIVVVRQSEGEVVSQEEINRVSREADFTQNVTRIVLGNSIVYLETALVDKQFYYSDFLSSVINMTSGYCNFTNPYPQKNKVEDIREKWLDMNSVSKTDLTLASLFTVPYALPNTLNSFIAHNGLYRCIHGGVLDDYKKYAERLTAKP